VYERIRSEQHRLNYERLRGLYDKLLNDMNAQSIEKDKRNVLEENEAGGPQSTNTELIKSPKRCSLQTEMTTSGTALALSSGSGPSQSPTLIKTSLNNEPFRSSFRPTTLLSPNSTTGLVR